MAEIADMMIEGEMCQTCGEYLGGGDGYARFCSGCDPRRHGQRDYKKDQKRFHESNNNSPQDLDLLKTLPVRYTLENDGEAGEKYVIDIVTDRGVRTVDWWVSSRMWKVRKGRGEGQGIYKLARYFQLIPRNEQP